MFIATSINVLAQTEPEDYYVWFDAQIGQENTGLFNGTRYREKYRLRNEMHKFYVTSYFQKGNINYGGQSYYDIDVKYDLFEDQLIININTSSGSNILQLIKSKIQGFEMNDKVFVQIKNGDLFKSSEPIDGFYEYLLENDLLILYKKHKKERLKFLDGKVTLSEFKSDNEYFLYHEKVFYSISKKSDWNKVFPDSKKLISTFYTDYDYLLEENYDSFLMQLADKINASSNHIKPEQ